MSKKQERIQKLIALDNMIRYQTRGSSGAKFTNEQLDSALQVLEAVLKLDNVGRIPANSKVD